MVARDYQERIWWARKTLQACEQAIQDYRKNVESYDAIRDMRKFSAPLAGCGSEDGDDIADTCSWIAQNPPVYLHDLWDLRRDLKQHIADLEK